MSSQKLIKKIESEGIASTADMDFIIEIIEQNELFKKEIKLRKSQASKLISTIDSNESEIRKLKSEVEELTNQLNMLMYKYNALERETKKNGKNK